MGVSASLEKLNPTIGALILRLGALLVWVSLAAFAYMRQHNLPFVTMVMVLVVVGLVRWRSEQDPDTVTFVLLLTGVAAVML